MSIWKTNRSDVCLNYACKLKFTSKSLTGSLTVFILQLDHDEAAPERTV